MNYGDIILKLSRYSRNKKHLHAFLHRTSNVIASFSRILSDETFAKHLYKRYTGKSLNLDNPVTFNEKLWWLKLHYRNPLQITCTDKFLVREYVKQYGLNHILTKLYGVYQDARHIDLDSFDHEVFIKCNHGSGTNIIYNPQNPFAKRHFQRMFNYDLRQNHYYHSREWNYKDIKPSIICEEVLRDANGQLPLDYKFMCFEGEPKLLFLEGKVCCEDGRRNVGETRYVNVYDMSFNLLPIKSGVPNNAMADSERPANFEQMIEYARILSKPFPHCRVDLYNVDGHIYFGEITFYHGGGCIDIQPEKWANQMGEWIDITKIPDEIL